MKRVRRVLPCATSCRSTRGNAIPLSGLCRLVPGGSENSVTQALPKTPGRQSIRNCLASDAKRGLRVHRFTPNRRRSVGHLHSSRSARHAITWYRSRAVIARPRRNVRRDSAAQYRVGPTTKLVVVLSACVDVLGWPRSATALRSQRAHGQSDRRQRGPCDRRSPCTPGSSFGSGP